MSYLNDKMERLKYWEEEKKKCIYCGGHVSFEEISMDHIQPSAKKGKTNNYNLVISCRDCNLSKADMNIEVFEEYIKKLHFLLRKDLMFRLLLRHFDVKITRKSKFMEHKKIKDMLAYKGKIKK